MDHLCKTKNCVNPDHLEPVTLEENQRRHWGAHCPRGHEFTPENSARNSRGARLCRKCRQIYGAALRAKKKAERAESRAKALLEAPAKTPTPTRIRKSRGVANLKLRRTAVKIAHELGVMLRRLDAAEIGTVS